MDFVACQMVAPRKRTELDRERLAAVAHSRAAAKHKGRNHWRNWERRQMAAEKRRAAMEKLTVKQSVFDRYKRAARAYWAGETEAHPRMPA